MERLCYSHFLVDETGVICRSNEIAVSRKIPSPIDLASQTPKSHSRITMASAPGSSRRDLPSPVVGGMERLAAGSSGRLMRKSPPHGTPWPAATCHYRRGEFFLLVSVLELNESQLVSVPILFYFCKIYFIWGKKAPDLVCLSNSFLQLLFRNKTDLAWKSSGFGVPASL